MEESSTGSLKSITAPALIHPRMVSLLATASEAVGFIRGSSSSVAANGLASRLADQIKAAIGFYDGQVSADE